MIRLVTTLGGFREAAQALRAAASRLPDATGQLAGEAAAQTKRALQETAPVGKATPGGREPGGLRKSIDFDLSGTKAEFLASDVAGYVIGGTPPHDIEGAAGPLHFFWEQKGGFVTFMRVRHPGTAANDFRVPALEQAAQETEALLEQFGDELVDGLAG